MVETLPDIFAKRLSVLFCGINPGLHAATTGHHFAGRSNRFWKTLHLAGFTPEQIEAENDHSLLAYGCGLTTVVERATAGAADLSRREFVASAGVFRKKIARYEPRYVAFLGKAAYAALTGRRDIAWGPQAEAMGRSAIWILPNPSGRNLAFKQEALVEAYRQLHDAVSP